MRRERNCCSFSSESPPQQFSLPPFPGPSIEKPNKTQRSFSCWKGVSTCRRNQVAKRKTDPTTKPIFVALAKKKNLPLECRNGREEGQFQIIAIWRRLPRSNSVLSCPIFPLGLERGNQEKIRSCISFYFPKRKLTTVCGAVC